MRQHQPVSLDSRRTSRRLRGSLDLRRRIKRFAQSTAHRAGNHRLLCMGLFSQFLF